MIGFVVDVIVREKVEQEWVQSESWQREKCNALTHSLYGHMYQKNEKIVLFHDKFIQRKTHFLSLCIINVTFRWCDILYFVFLDIVDVLNWATIFEHRVLWRIHIKNYFVSILKYTLHQLRTLQEQNGCWNM